MSTKPVLERVREICLALPEATETTTFGHPTFQAGKKTFAVLDEYKGEKCLALKLEVPKQQEVLKSSRFFESPYGAKHGWVCMRTSGELDYDEIRELCTLSYRAVALKRMVDALDAASVISAAPRKMKKRR